MEFWIEGALARVEYDEKLDSFVGHVVEAPGLWPRDTVSFRGRSLDELRRECVASMRAYREEKAKHLAREADDS